VELIVELAGFGRTVVPKMSRLRDSDQKEKEAAKLAEQFGLNIDLREGSRVISDFHEQGIDAVPFISPPNNLFVPQPDGHRKSVIEQSSAGKKKDGENQRANVIQDGVDRAGERSSLSPTVMVKEIQKIYRRRECYR
jgi:hypothetical protein